MNLIERYPRLTFCNRSAKNTVGISVAVSKKIQLVGCQIYGPQYLKESTYNLDICLQDGFEEKTLVSLSDKKLTGEKTPNDVMFDPVTLVADRDYHITVSLEGENHICDEGQQNIQTTGDVVFTFNKTRGQEEISTDLGKILGLFWKRDIA